MIDSGFSISVRTLTTILLTIPPFLALLALCAVTPAFALDQVTLQLKWQHQFQFAGYYAAKQQGYYRDAGLDVTILPATPGKDPVLDVIDGKAQYGVGTSSLLLVRDAGKPVVALAVIFQHSPYILLTKQFSASQTIHSLAGKRLMLEPEADELIAYLKSEGISLESLQVSKHTFSINDLIVGNVDAMSGYITDDPHELERAGFAYHAYTPRSAGIDFYGDNLFTTENEIRNHPARVRAFREASLKGWHYALKHPDTTIDLIISTYSPQSNRAHLKYEAGQIRQLMHPDLLEIGYMNAGRWQHIADTYASLGMLWNKVELRKFMYDPDPHADLTLYYRIAGALLGIALLASAVRLIKTTRDLKRSEEHIHRQFDEISLINATLEHKVEERTEELRLAKRDAEEANLAKSRFLAIVAHEFRTPLALLSMSVDIVDRYSERLSTEELQNQHQQIRNAKVQMARLIDSVLVFSHQGKTTFPEAPLLLDVAEVCRTVAEEIILAWGREHTFSIVIDPACGRQLLIEIPFRRIITNLLTNALRFTPPGGSVTFSVALQEDRLVIQVADTGIGIPEEEQQKVFEAFCRGSNVDTRRGLGLGLSIVNEAVHLMNGTISLISTVGVGSIFRVELPV